MMENIDPKIFIYLCFGAGMGAIAFFGVVCYLLDRFGCRHDFTGPFLTVDTHPVVSINIKACRVCGLVKADITRKALNFKVVED